MGDDEEFAQPQDDPADDAPSAAHVSDIEREILGKPRKRNRRETPEERGNREQREADAFWRGILADPIGRRELWRLFCGSQGAHAFETRFPAGPVGFPDANAAWYERGVQDFGQRMHRHWLRLDAASVGLMHNENDPAFKPEPERKA